VRDRRPLPAIDLQRGHQLQQLVTGQRGHVDRGQRLPRGGKLVERKPNR
jgi:hypothetical protein